jgi:predicted aspartyl protease
VRAVLALFGLLALLAGCAEPGDDFDFDTCGVRPRVRIPVAMRGNVPLVLGSIKGVPAVFVLDTGADSVVLTEGAVAKFGLDIDRRALVTGVGIGGQTRGFAGHLKDLQIGDLVVPDHRVRLLPADSGIAGTGIDGLFGVSVLSVFEVDLDLPNGLVTLYAGRLCPDTVAPDWAGAAIMVDASRSERGRFAVPVMVDGHEFNALLDTGAGLSLLSTRAAGLLGVTAEVLARDGVAMLAGTGPGATRAAVHRFDTIEIAGERFSNRALAVTTLPDRAFDMIIGSDYLAHRRIWLSYARRRAYIAPLGGK